MPRLTARNNKELRALAKGLGVPMSKLEPGPLPILLVCIQGIGPKGGICPGCGTVQEARK